MAIRIIGRKTNVNQLMSVALIEPVASSRTSGHAAPRWLHGWAVLTAALTFVLLTLGAMVTTFRAGMADPDWPTLPWHLLLVPWQSANARLIIEHSHRLAGYLVFFCALALVVGLYASASQRWICRLGIVALCLVVVQGLIGGFRVRLNEMIGTDLAMTHGAFASVVFSTLTSIALFTSRGWQAPIAVVESSVNTQRLRRLSVVVAGLIFVQIVLGSVLRHQYSSLGQRGHLLMAFAVVFGVAWLIREISESAVERATRITAATLGCLIGVQLLLGVEAWMLKYFVPAHAAVQALIRTSHVLVGYLSLATAVIVACRVYRRNSRTAEFAPVHNWGTPL